VQRRKLLPDSLRPQTPSRSAVAEGSALEARNGWVRTAQNLLLLLTLAGIVYYFAHDFDRRQKGTDFSFFYCAARMVHEGYGHQLYNFAVQDQFQIRYAGRIGDYYNHPPFETLLFLPLSLGSLQTAYVLWCVVNVVVLAWAAIAFQRHVWNRWDWRVLLPLFFLFPPVLLSFSQGQDSLFMFLIMTLALVDLKRGRNFKAGFLLGFGLIKFHIILTLVALVAVSFRRKRFLGGFAVAFFALLVISAGISGWEFLTAYPRFLKSLSSVPLAGIHPAAMANIRGLVTISGVLGDTAGRFILIWVLSILLVWRAWTSFKPEGRSCSNLAFGNFVLAAILVSYHLSPTDLCMALLPMGLFLQYLAEQIAPEHAIVPRWGRFGLLVTMGVLYLPPLHVISLAGHEYVYPVIPILIMFLVTSSARFRGVPKQGGEKVVVSAY
jgi:Glycosyltransferase family 87